MDSKRNFINNHDMAYLLIYDDLYVDLKNRYHERVGSCYIGRAYHDNRYIQIYTPLKDADVHYEYIGGKVELHFEGDSLYKHRALVDRLMRETENDNRLVWFEWYGSQRCQLNSIVHDRNELYTNIETMMNIFDEPIKQNTKGSGIDSFENLEIKDCIPDHDSSVEMYHFAAETVLELPLKIPEYQRIYCWEEDNVKCLLDDILNHNEKQSNKESAYRLGSVILHQHNGFYDIIDGQQRLVTLALILQNLGVKCPILKESFGSSKAREYIAYNKYIINVYLQKHLQDRAKLVTTIRRSLEFDVLVLKNTSIDLAYSFFSNENSRGVVLSDYDLLKAHHLRFIPQTYEKQSERAAAVWNEMIEDGRINIDENGLPDYEKTLDTYLYRLRKWLRNRECEEGRNNRRVKKEYEAAPIMDEIPPFGEKFYFGEPIQGGSHFFSFVEQYLQMYRHFIQTEAYKAIHQNMSSGTDTWYRDAIEAVLFGYYAKFGESYLVDALVVIMRIVLQHRYENERTRKRSIMNYVGEQQLVHMINQATSPTFFLAEARNAVKDMPLVYIQDLRPVQKNLKDRARIISNKLRKYIIVEYFKGMN